jgi:hypothetical protein
MKKTNATTPQQPPESPALVAATAAVRETRLALNQIIDRIDYASQKYSDGTPKDETETVLYQAEQAAKLPALAAAYAEAWENYLKARGIQS